MNADSASFQPMHEFSTLLGCNLKAAFSLQDYIVYEIIEDSGVLELTSVHGHRTA
jgi:hypothetical protein